MFKIFTKLPNVKASLAIKEFKFIIRHYIIGKRVPNELRALSMRDDLGCVIFVTKPSFGFFVKVFRSTIFPLLFTFSTIGLMLFLSEKLSFAILLELIMAFSGLTLPYLWLPKAYTLTTRGVVIKRFVGNVFIPYREIVKLKIVNFDDIIRYVKCEEWALSHIALWFLRIILTLFETSSSEKVHLYVTNVGKHLLIEKVNGEKYVINPCGMERFSKILTYLTGLVVE